jgi:phosphatidylserine/phosphatidylglycerophosphate/cardiolipin synthase-like enzyme
VKVLVTPSAKGWNKRLGGLVMLLKDAGVDVRKYQGHWPKYHAKYLVVDDSTAMIGSMNLTRKCFEETCDFLLVSRQDGLISGLNALFDFDWHLPHTPLPLLCDRLIVGPNHARSRIVELLERARYRIRIVDHRLTDPEILLLIARKMLDGVRVQILGRGELGSLSSHGKMIIVDDHFAFFGSVALSRAGLDIRREVAVVVEEPAIVETLSRFFERMSELNAARKDRLGGQEDEDEDEDED